MAQLLEFLTVSGDAVLFEVITPDDIQPLAADGSDIIRKANQTLESALATGRHAQLAKLCLRSRIRERSNGSGSKSTPLAGSSDVSLRPHARYRLRAMYLSISAAWSI